MDYKTNLILPKFLFNKEYKMLNNNDRCIYAILYTYLIESDEEKQCDNEGNFYINYSQEKLANYSRLERKTVATSLAKLSDLDLICIKRLGFNKPSRIYIIPLITECHIWKM